MFFIRRCWFLKCSEEIHYVPIGDGDMWYYVPIDDGWEEVLGHNVYITSQYFSPNAKYWTTSSGNRTRAPQIECGRSTIELCNLYIIWVCLRPSTSLQMPNIELHRPGIEPGPPPDRMWTLYHWAMESVHNMVVLVSWPPGRVKSYVTIAPPPHPPASILYLHYGGGGGALPASPLPLNTCSHNTATRRPPHPSNTQQHTATHKNTQQQTTTHNNSTQQHSGT
jgi:hypothetical protein